MEAAAEEQEAEPAGVENAAEEAAEEQAQAPAEDAAEETAAQEPEEEGPLMARITASSLTVRAEASYTGEIIGYADYNSMVEIADPEPEGDWIQIRWEGKKAYVNRSFIDLEEGE